MKLDEFMIEVNDGVKPGEKQHFPSAWVGMYHISCSEHPESWVYRGDAHLDADGDTLARMLALAATHVCPLEAAGKAPGSPEEAFPAPELALMAARTFEEHSGYLGAWRKGGATPQQIMGLFVTGALLEKMTGQPGAWRSEIPDCSQAREHRPVCK